MPRSHSLKVLDQGSKSRPSDITIGALTSTSFAPCSHSDLTRYKSTHTEFLAPAPVAPGRNCVPPGLRPVPPRPCLLPPAPGPCPALFLGHTRLTPASPCPCRSCRSALPQRPSPAALLTEVSVGTSSERPASPPGLKGPQTFPKSPSFISPSELLALRVLSFQIVCRAHICQETLKSRQASCLSCSRDTLSPWHRPAHARCLFIVCAGGRAGLQQCSACV